MGCRHLRARLLRFLRVLFRSEEALPPFGIHIGQFFRMHQVQPGHDHPRLWRPSLSSIRSPGNRRSTNQINKRFRFVRRSALDFSRTPPRARGSVLLYCRTVGCLQGPTNSRTRSRPRVGEEDVVPRSCRTSVIPLLWVFLVCVYTSLLCHAFLHLSPHFSCFPCICFGFTRVFSAFVKCNIVSVCFNICPNPPPIQNWQGPLPLSEREAA